MVQAARVTFYSVARCGFYRHGDKQPTFGGLAETFGEIEKWSDGLELSLTRISDPPPDAEALPTYLLGAARCHDGWVFSYWNEVPATDARAPLEHGNKMVPPLKEHGKAHRWILLEGVEHGVAREKQAQQFYPALFEFLDAHIGAKAASGEAVAASH